MPEDDVIRLDIQMDHRIRLGIVTAYQCLSQLADDLCCLRALQALATVKIVF
jgi:hypothetical protein